VSPVGPLTLVLNQVQVFTAVASGGTGALSYQWYLDGAVVSGQTASSYSYTATLGSHLVYVRVTDSASPPVSVNSNSVSVTVNSVGFAVSVSPVGPLTLVLNQVQVFTAVASGGTGALSYQWYLDGVADSGQTTSTYSYTPVLGSHGIQVNVTDSASPPGSVLSNLVMIKVNPPSGFATRLVVSSVNVQTTGVAFPLTVTATDDYNNPATNYNGVVRFTSSDSQAVLPANIALKNGVGIFNVTLITTGWQSVTVTDTVISSISGSQFNIRVDLASGVTFVVSGIPSPSIAGVVQSVTVTAKDVNNNLVKSYSGTVRFTSSDSQAVLPANVGLINGVGSFSVTLKTAGIQSITATDATVSSIDGSQTGITVKPSALDHFSILVPGAVTADTTFGGVSVTAYDVYNNVKTDYAGSVYFTCSDSAAVLPYTSTSKYLFVNGNNGVHIFSGFTMETTPSQTISVTDGSISKQSASITVNIPGQPTPTPTPPPQGSPTATPAPGSSNSGSPSSSPYGSPTAKPAPSNSTHVSPSPLPSGINLNSDLIELPLSFLDISVFFAFLSIILLPTSKLLPRYYQMVTPLVRKLEAAAVLVSVLFLLTVAIQVALAILNL